MLAWLDMSEYYDRFLQAGFDSWSVLCEITEEDFEALAVERGHRRKLQKEIAMSRPRSHQVGSRTPSAPSGKRSYRHHPKPDPNAPQRPYAAYVMFSNHVREEMKGQSMPFTEISKMVGDKWQALPAAEKERWKQLAAVPWEKYKQDLAIYQQTENYRKYEQYVADFKAAQLAKQNESRGWVSPKHGVQEDMQSSASEADPNSPASTSALPSTSTPVPSLTRNTRPIAPATTVEKTKGKRPASKVAISRAKTPAATGGTATTRAPRVTQGMFVLKPLVSLFGQRLQHQFGRAKQDITILTYVKSLRDSPQ